jgi:TonB family protein
MEAGHPDHPARRSAASGALSLAIHGGLIGFAILLASRVATKPARPATIPIEVVAAPAPAGAGALVPSVPSGNAGTLGRRSPEAPKRSQTRAPAAADPRADLVMRYDKPQAAHDSGNGAVPGGIAGLTGARSGDAGIGGLDVPPADSLGEGRARPPRPKLPYDHWEYLAPEQFTGMTVLVELTIDPQGRVDDVRVLKGLDPIEVDRRAVAYARSFEFYPKLDDDGQPQWSRYHWEFLLEGRRKHAARAEAAAKK